MSRTSCHLHIFHMPKTWILHISHARKELLIFFCCMKTMFARLRFLRVRVQWVVVWLAPRSTYVPLSSESHTGPLSPKGINFPYTCEKTCQGVACEKLSKAYSLHTPRRTSTPSQFTDLDLRVCFCYLFEGEGQVYYHWAQGHPHTTSGCRYRIFRPDPASLNLRRAP